MEKDNYEYIAKRCNEALIESKEYSELESSDPDPVDTQELAEIICYQKGFKDALRMFVECL